MQGLHDTDERHLTSEISRLQTNMLNQARRETKEGRKKKIIFIASMKY